MHSDVREKKMGLLLQILKNLSNGTDAMEGNLLD